MGAESDLSGSGKDWDKADVRHLAAFLPVAHLYLPSAADMPILLVHRLFVVFLQPGVDISHFCLAGCPGRLIQYHLDQ